MASPEFSEGRAGSEHILVASPEFSEGRAVSEHFETGSLSVIAVAVFLGTLPPGSEGVDPLQQQPASAIGDRSRLLIKSRKIHPI